METGNSQQQETYIYIKGKEEKRGKKSYRYDDLRTRFLRRLKNRRFLLVKLMNWKAFGIGDFERAEPANDAERALLKESVEHLTDLKKYISVYDKPNEYTDYPPEYLNGMQLDIRLSKIKSLIISSKAKSVLDVGCRTGFLLFSLADVLETGVGIDISQSAIDMCRRYQHDKNINNLQFKRALFEEYEDPIKYDVVVMAEVLEHIINPTVFLQKAHKFSDRLIISVPVESPYDKDKGNNLKYQEHVRCLDKERMKPLLAHTQWQILEYSQLTCYFLTDIYDLIARKPPASCAGG